MEQERQLDKMDDTSGETNPYKELIVNNAERTEPLMTQMEQWSILSNILNYVQHSRLHSINHTLDIRQEISINIDPVQTIKHLKN